MAAAYKDKGAIRLDVVRKNVSSGMDWDELMEVKTACGFGDMDAVELYPSNADVINTGNVRHIYIFNDRIDLVKRGA